jgi:hypothetical protein
MTDQDRPEPTQFQISEERESLVREAPCRRSPNGKHVFVVASYTGPAYSCCQWCRVTETPTDHTTRLEIRTAR